MCKDKDESTSYMRIGQSVEGIDVIERMKWGRGKKGLVNRLRGIEMLITEALAKIKSTDPFR